MAENWRIHWKDYYKILQVDPSAEPEVIKAAYEKLARKYHPDVNKDRVTGSRMSDINEAYEILKDPVYRKLYHAEWLHKTDQPIIKHRVRFNFGWILLICIIIGGIVFITVHFKQQPISIPVQVTETNSPATKLNVKLKSISLPTDARISTGDLLYEQWWVVVNNGSSDLRIYWEATSSLSGIFDSGYISVSAHDSREIKRSYSYTIAGTEKVTYKLFYGNIVLDTLSATHEISK